MLANLKALRTAQGLSQRALADFVKVSQQSINQYENRDTEPDIAVLTRIADYFGVSIDYLVGHDPAAGELIPTNLTDAELRLILNFRQLDDDQQRSMNLLVMQIKNIIHHQPQIHADIDGHPASVAFFKVAHKFPQPETRLHKCLAAPNSTYSLTVQLLQTSSIRWPGADTGTDAVTHVF